MRHETRKMLLLLEVNQLGMDQLGHASFVTSDHRLGWLLNVFVRGGRLADMCTSSATST